MQCYSDVFVKKIISFLLILVSYNYSDFWPSLALGSCGKRKRKKENDCRGLKEWGD